MWLDVCGSGGVWGNERMVGPSDGVDGGWIEASVAEVEGVELQIDEIDEHNHEVHRIHDPGVVDLRDVTGGGCSW